MVDYLTSSESLEKLCEIQPDQPIKHGKRKLFSGIGLTLLGAGSAWGGWEMMYLFDSPNPRDNILGILVEIAFGMITLISGYNGIKNLADGITSLRKPRKVYSEDDSVYYRNGGFTKTPSTSDKKFGDKVSPIENMDDLQDGYVLINGLYVKEINFESEMKLRGAPPLNAPQPYKQHTVRIDGGFKGQPVRAFTVTEDEQFAKSLARKEKNSFLYIMGSVDKERGIEIKEFGD
ncbi:hypothetical protein KY339_02230, partial [Candidatus Woesearchaeota archaeon]|nr:hypothetical protein [Candidatus Woesearchaeota archaeon]